MSPGLPRFQSVHPRAINYAPYVALAGKAWVPRLAYGAIVVWCGAVRYRMRLVYTRAQSTSRTCFTPRGPIVGLLASGSNPTCPAGCVKKTYKRNALTPRLFSLVFVVGSVDLPIYIRAYSIIQLHSNVYKMKLFISLPFEP